MTLLAPIPAIAALGLALPTLLTFYLLKLRRRPVRVSSTMFWEQATRDLQVNVPLRWLRPSLLLLLHVLILLLLAGALGRPAIMDDGASRSKVFLIIDRTASMSASDMPGGQSRFEAARRRADELAQDLLGGLDAPSVTLIALGHDARVLTPPTRSLGEIQRAIAQLEPTDQPGRLEDALTLIESLIGAETDESVDGQPALAVLVSDGVCARGSALSLAGADVRFERVAPAPGAPADNVAIVGLGASRDADDPTLVRLFVATQSVSPERVATTLEISVDGVRVQRRPLILEPAGEHPSTGAVTTELRLTQAGVVRVRLEREDALESDNIAQLALPAPSRPRVLLVAPDASPDRFLRDVLQELDLASLRIAATEDYERFLAGDMSSIDLVVLDRAGRAPPGIASLSFGVPVPGLVEQGESPGPDRVITWKRSDPVLRDVSLDTLLVGRRPLLVPDQELGAIRVETLASADTGDLVWRTRSTGVERIVVSFAINRSNWGLQVSLPIFVVNAVEALTGRLGGDDAVRFTTSEPAEVVAPGSREVVRLTGPIEREIRVPDGVDRSAPINLGILERVGVYSIDGSDASVCVNLLNERESRLSSPESIEVGGRPVEPSGAADAPAPREIWHWLVLAAAGLLALEWFLYAWRMRV